MKVQDLTPELEAAYERFVLTQANGFLYYSIKYRNLICELLNAESKYQIALNKGEICGVLPILIANGRYGKVLNSLPYYGSYGSVLSDCAEAKEALWNKYADFALNSNFSSSTIIINPLELSNGANIPFDVIDKRVCQISQLPQNTKKADQEILDSIDSSARRNIRKAIESKIEVSVESNEVNFLEITHQQNMHEIGGHAKSSNFFNLFIKHFKSNTDYKIFVARVNGEKIAAILFFYYNGIVEYFTPVVLSNARQYQPTSIILFKAMIDAVESGFRLWNWGGTWASQEGVFRYKKKWGAIELPYEYYIKINNPILLTKTKEELLEEYPDFYVLPFNLLK